MSSALVQTYVWIDKSGPWCICALHCGTALWVLNILWWCHMACYLNQKWPAPSQSAVFTLSCTRWTSTCLLSLSCPTECVSCVTLSLVALSHFSISGRWRTTFQSAPVWSGGGFFDLQQHILWMRLCTICGSTLTTGYRQHVMGQRTIVVTNPQKIINNQWFCFTAWNTGHFLLSIPQQKHTGRDQLLRKVEHQAAKKTDIFLRRWWRTRTELKREGILNTNTSPMGLSRCPVSFECVN